MLFYHRCGLAPFVVLKQRNEVIAKALYLVAAVFPPVKDRNDFDDFTARYLYCVYGEKEACIASAGIANNCYPAP